MFVRIRGKIVGPLDESKVRELVRQGKISRASEVSTDGQNWSRAGENMSLFTALQRGEIAEPTSFEALLAKEKVVPLAEQENDELKIWFYSVDGRVGFGPHTRNEIGTLIQQGTLNADGLVWRQGEMADTVRYTVDFSEFIHSTNTKKKSAYLPKNSSSTPNSSLLSETISIPELPMNSPQSDVQNSRETKGNGRSGNVVSSELLRETLRLGPWVTFLAIVVSICIAAIALSCIGGLYFFLSFEIGFGYKLALAVISTAIISLMLYFPFLLWRVHSSISELAVHRTVEKEIGVMRQVTNLFRTVVFQILALAVLSGVAFALVFA